MATLVPQDAMAQIFSARLANDLPPLPNFNICPTDPVHVLRLSGEGRSGEGRGIVSMRWGFIPHWYKAANDGPLLINARAETIAQKPAFRAAARERRCIVPASGYFEWAKDESGKRLPWYYTRKDGEPLAFAGVWQRWEGPDGPIETCAMVTTQANTMTGKVHHRMPVILEPDAWGKWLGEEGKGAALLMTPAPDDTLSAHRVSTAVNSNRASGSELIEPWEPEVL